MAAQTKKQQLKEIEYQTRMLNNLKKWIRNLIILSSCGMGIAYWAIKIQEGLMFNIIGRLSGRSRVCGRYLPLICRTCQEKAYRLYMLCSCRAGRRFF